MDILLYDVPASITDEQIMLGFGFWGKLILVTKKLQKKYMTLRVKITLNQQYLILYRHGDWAIPFDDFFVHWFPVTWTLSERKK